MPTNTITSAVYTGGRIVSLVVLALLALAVVYAITMVAMNWSVIGV